jgi:hypothetical protein
MGKFYVVFLIRFQEHSLGAHKTGLGYTGNRTTSLRCKMPDSLKILALKRKPRGRKILRGGLGVGDVTIYRVTGNELVKHSVIKRGYTKKRWSRAGVHGMFEGGALVAVESRPRIHKPSFSSETVQDQAKNPNLEKFKAAFGTLKGLKVFGEDVVQFQRAMREEWQ